MLLLLLLLECLDFWPLLETVIVTLIMTGSGSIVSWDSVNAADHSVIQKGECLVPYLSMYGIEITRESNQKIMTDAYLPSALVLCHSIRCSTAAQWYIGKSVLLFRPACSILSLLSPNHFIV